MATESLLDTSDQLTDDFLLLGEWVFSTIKECRRRNQPLPDATVKRVYGLISQTCAAVHRMHIAVDEHMGLEPNPEDKRAVAEFAAELPELDAKVMSKALSSVKRAARLKVPRNWN